jgi:aminodeoxyfutalosine deaminase
VTARAAAGIPGRDLTTLPKVELHVHLEGSVSAATAADLAQRHGEDPAVVLGLQDGDYPRRYRDFQHFVDTFLATSRQLRTPDDLAAVAAAFARSQAAQGVRYTEVTVTALTLVNRGMEPAGMWAALRDGLGDAADTRIGIIVDSVRELGPQAARRTVSLVEDADAPIVGLGLTGVEGSVPEGDFVHLRQAADRLGLGLSVHAGETGTADNVRAAVDDLGADRIGHGIAAVDDPELLARLARDRVPFEVCPSSNVSLGVVADLEEHPLPTLWAAGAAVTIGSDDPPFFSTTLVDELAHATRLLGLTRRELAEMQRRAARAAFAPREVRDDLLARIDAWDAGPGV